MKFTNALVILAAALSLAACAGKNSGSQPGSTLTRDGGNSGGGGDSTQDVLVTEAQARDLVKYSKPVVIGWFNQIQYLYRNADHGYWREIGLPTVPDDRFRQLLFEGSKTVFSALEKTQIEIPANGACHESTGADVDGSVIARTSGNICISVERLSKKLTVAEAEKQITALIIHEVTHLVGGDESDAVAVQNMALSTLGENPSHKMQQSYMIAVFQLQSALTSAENILKNRRADPLSRFQLSVAYSDQISIVQEGVSNFLYVLPVLNIEDFDELDQMQMRVEMMTSFYCTQLRPKDCQTRYGRMYPDYNAVFGSDSQLSVDQILLRTRPTGAAPLIPHLHPMIVKRLTSVADAQTELQIEKDYYEKFDGVLTNRQADYFDPIDVP